MYLKLCMCAICILAYQGQKSALDPQKLELQVVVNYHVSTGN